MSFGLAAEGTRAAAESREPQVLAEGDSRFES